MKPNDHAHWPWIPQLRSIPREFYSLELDGPFEKCLLCDLPVRNDAESEYYIERVFRGAEPIIEYAICMACHDKVCEELSTESMQKIEQLFHEIDYDHRLSRLRDHLDDQGIDAWLDRCLAKQKARAECRKGYQIIGRFRGNQLVLDWTPIMLCEEFMEEIQSVISKKTRERLDDFVGTNFGMPSEFCDLPDFRPVLV